MNNPDQKTAEQHCRNNPVCARHEKGGHHFGKIRRRRSQILLIAEVADNQPPQHITDSKRRADCQNHGKDVWIHGVFLFRSQIPVPIDRRLDYIKAKIQKLPGRLQQVAGINHRILIDEQIAEQNLVADNNDQRRQLVHPVDQQIVFGNPPFLKHRLFIVFFSFFGNNRQLFLAFFRRLTQWLYPPVDAFQAGIEPVLRFQQTGTKVSQKRHIPADGRIVNLSWF